MLTPASVTPRAANGRAWGAAIGLLALGIFGLGVRSEPHFVDESAIIAKSYFANLWLCGRWDDPAWLEYPSLDHPPLSQYLTGLGLWAGGHPFPSRGVIRAWYRDTRVRGEDDEALAAARWPSAILGAAGCVAIYALGTTAGGHRLGVVAALLLMANPLYRLHARRAIGDVPCQALILASLAVALPGWRDALAGRLRFAQGAATAMASGSLGGLAVLAKLNGGLGLLTLAAWALLAMALPGVTAQRKYAVATMAAIAGVVAFATFLMMNPLLTAHPVGPLTGGPARLAQVGLWGRVGLILRNRAGAMDQGRDQFPHNALRTPGQKLAVVAVQGFGRFGPFGPAHTDSTRRFDWKQDRGALIWLPWVASGAAWALALGRRQGRNGEPATAWAIALQALVALTVVTAFIPLAWDRYILDIQPGSALLAAGAAVAGYDRLRRIIGRMGLATAPYLRSTAKSWALSPGDVS